MTNYPDACPICGAPKVAVSLYACIERDTPCDPNEIDRRVEAGIAAQQRMDAFLASLPPRYRRYATTPVAPEVLATNTKARAALQAMTPQGFLYLTGDPGVGKTHLAVRQAVNLIREGFSAQFVDEVEYFERVFAEFGGGRPAPSLIAPDVLIYDDLGKQKPSDFALQKLYHMLEMRWSHEKATIITSNLTPQAVGPRISDDPAVAASIVSRLMAGQAVGLRGADNRPGSAV